MSFRVIRRFHNHKLTQIWCTVNNVPLYMDHDCDWQAIYITADIQPPLQDYLNIVLIAEGFNNPLPGRVVYRLLFGEFDWPIGVYNDIYLR